MQIILFLVVLVVVLIVHGCCHILGLCGFSLTMNMLLSVFFFSSFGKPYGFIIGIIVLSHEYDSRSQNIVID